MRILTDNIQIGHLALHRIGVDLTHVPAHVRLLDFADFQYPLALLCVRDDHAMVFGDYVTLDGENCLRVDAQPGNLCVFGTFKWCLNWGREWMRTPKVQI